MSSPWSVTDVEEGGRKLLVRQTTTSKARKQFGRAMRSGQLWQIDDTFPSTPRFDKYAAGSQSSSFGRPHSTATSTPADSKAVVANAILRKGSLDDFRRVEAQGRTTWTKGMPATRPWSTAAADEQPDSPTVRGTFTSLLREAIASAPRVAMKAEAGSQQMSQSMSDFSKGRPGGSSAHSPTSPVSPQRYITLDGRQLGKPPKRGQPVAWANRMFHDSGLGLGPRLPSFETPGPGPGGYRMQLNNDAGSVALWNDQAGGLSTKQPLANHHSTIANRFGSRRGEDREQRERAAAPGPGYYKHRSFVDEMLASTKPKRRTLTVPNSWCSIP